MGNEMEPLAGTLYTSTVVPLHHGEWRQVRLPQTVVTEHGTLTTSGQAFGIHVSPTDAIPTVPAKLVVLGALPSTVDVELELAVWSKDQRELGIRPQRRLPLRVSEARYLRAATATIENLAEKFKEGLLVSGPSDPELPLSA
jgi:hypothetical protein